MATEKTRLMVTVDDDLFEMIDDFQFKNHYPNRSMALQALVHAGLDALKDNPDPTPKKPTRKKRKPVEE